MVALVGAHVRPVATALRFESFDPTALVAGQALPAFPLGRLPSSRLALSADFRIAVAALTFARSSCHSASHEAINAPSLSTSPELWPLSLASPVTWPLACPAPAPRPRPQ